MAARGELVCDRDLDARIAVQALIGSGSLAGPAAEDRKPPSCRRAPVGPGRVGVLAPQCANITGHVYALNLATGATRWTRQPDAAGYWASPTISQGTIHITAKDGQLLTFALAGANR